MPALRRLAVPYGLATCVGLAAVAYALTPATIGGAGGVFAAPTGDLPTNLIGHVAFQRGGWSWPLLRAGDLAWPVGQSIAMTDSNPLMSLLGKMLAMLRGRPGNLLGLWLAACLVLQAVAAAYAVRGFGVGRGVNAVLAIGAAAVFALLAPEFLFRAIHINLLGQFVLLAALGLAVRWCRAGRPVPFGRVCGMLVLAVLIHPYLFLFCTMVLAAPVLQAVLARQAEAREGLRHLGLAALVAAGLFVLLNGSVAGGGPGYGLYSMDLLGPVWPQRSGLFGAGLPILDSTGFQMEGFNYLGAGAILAIGVACVLAGRRGAVAAWRAYPGLILVLLAMTALAITPHVTAGGRILLPIPCGWLEQPMAVLRASGRAFWMVGFAAVLAAVAFLARTLPPAAFAAGLAAVLALQWVDTAPLRRGAVDYFAGAGEQAPALVLPAALDLFGTIPVCGAESVVADEYRLLALRHGARLADARVAHDPPDAVCAARQAAALSTALMPGEARLFMPSVAALVKPAALGADVTCSAGGAGLLCYRPRSILGSTRPPPGR
jgi:hypothetical protein